jgi:nicotinamidase/pyrazinamidase
MVGEFAKEGNPYFVPATREILPNIERLVERQMAEGAKLYFCNDWHDEDDLEFQRMFPRHCVAGTPQAETIPELARFNGTIIPITRFDGFLYSTLDQKLRERAIERVIVCGVCTHIPVLHTAVGAAMRNYRVEVPTDAVADFDAELHRFALRQMKEVFGIKLTTCAELVGEG